MVKYVFEFVVKKCGYVNKYTSQGIQGSSENNDSIFRNQRAVNWERSAK